jgi:hypothetical protein
MTEQPGQNAAQPVPAGEQSGGDAAGAMGRARAHWLTGPLARVRTVASGRLEIDRVTVWRVLRDVVLPIAAIRVAIMVFGWLAVAMFAPDTLHESWAMWNHWDGPNFLQLAAGGYGPPTDPARIVLFPLYPATIALGALLFAPFDAAMLSSLVATFAAGLGLYELVRLDAPTRLARLSVFAMILFPTAYALVAPYSEALFLATTVWAFVAVRRGHMASAGVLGALAAATRIQGAFLIPALGIEYLMVRRRVDRDVFWILFVGAGLLVYLAINAYYFGDPMHFIQVQRETFRVQNQMPWITVQNLWNGVLGADRNERWVTLFIAPLASLVLLTVVTVWATFSKHSRPSNAIYTAISLVSFATLSWPISVPRYVMGVFPVFIAMGSWSRSPTGQSLLVASTLLLGAFTTLFLMGHWAF